VEEKFFVQPKAASRKKLCLHHKTFIFCSQSDHFAGQKKMLNDDTLQHCLEFAFDSLQVWCMIQQVCKHFYHVAHLDEMLAHAHLVLDHAAQLLTIGAAAKSVRSLKLKKATDLQLGLPYLGALHTLDLMSSGLTDASIVAQITSLRILDLSNNFYMTKMSALTDLTGLRSLSLAYCPRPDMLAAFTNLQSLKLNGLAVRNADLCALTNMPLLQFLDLYHCSQIDDEGLEIVSGVPSLTDLNVGQNNNITDEGVLNLRRLPKLEKLTLYLVPLLFDLRPFSTFPALKYLDVRECVNLYIAGLDLFTPRTKVYFSPHLPRRRYGVVMLSPGIWMTD
jgi:Leucine-rich repeat (LRR) protein